MIRHAEFADIPAMVAILKQLHSQSTYADICGVDETLAKQALLSTLSATMVGNAFAQVAVTEGKVTGFLTGVLMPVYQIGTKLMATDTFWVATDDVHPTEPMQLMRAFVKWAKTKPDVIEVLCGATSTVQDPEKAGTMLNRIGLKPYGNIYRVGLQ